MYMDDINFFCQKENKFEILIRTVQIFRQYTRMRLGIEKCQGLRISKGRLKITERIKLPTWKNMKKLEKEKKRKESET